MKSGFKIIFVEDDASVRDSMVQALELAGFEVCACESAERALRVLDGGSGRHHPILVTDLRLPAMDGIALMRQALAADPALPVVLVTGHGDVALAVQAMREGAYDFIEKPFTPARLIKTVTLAIDKRALQLEAEALRRQLAGQQDVEALLLGNSAAMRQVRRRILALADTSADVLVHGETGTGKEVVARCLHHHGRRHSGNFVAVNCGGIPETLFESEIFGHEAGAFTGALHRRAGKIEHAHGGTLLLDEIESLPLTFQVKLLRTLQERRVERLGSNESLRLDFRVVGATKFDLRALSEQGRFRSDLYYRLHVAVIELPPLRERREDIPLLFEHFVQQAALKHEREVPVVPTRHLPMLMAHHWPGNVRELRSMAERYVLGLLRGSEAFLSEVTQGGGAEDGQGFSLPDQMKRVECTLIEQAMQQHEGRPQLVCEALGIARKTYYDKVHRHGIRLDRYRHGGTGADEG